MAEDRHRLPGRDELAQPRTDHWRPDRRADPLPRAGDDGGAGEGAGQGTARQRGHRPRPVPQLPSRALRRDAPTGADRHGTRVPATADRRRRAGHRAGCYDPGTDPGPVAQPH